MSNNEIKKSNQQQKTPTQSRANKAAIQTLHQNVTFNTAFDLLLQNVRIIINLNEKYNINPSFPSVKEICTHLDLKNQQSNQDIAKKYINPDDQNIYITSIRNIHTIFENLRNNYSIEIEANKKGYLKRYLNNNKKDKVKKEEELNEKLLANILITRSLFMKTSLELNQEANQNAVLAVYGATAYPIQRRVRASNNLIKNFNVSLENGIIFSGGRSWTGIVASDNKFEPTDEEITAYLNKQDTDFDFLYSIIKDGLNSEIEFNERYILLFKFPNVEFLNQDKRIIDELRKRSLLVTEIHKFDKLYDVIYKKYEEDAQKTKSTKSFDNWLIQDYLPNKMYEDTYEESVYELYSKVFNYIKSLKDPYKKHKENEELDSRLSFAEFLKKISESEKPEIYTKLNDVKKFYKIVKAKYDDYKKEPDNDKDFDNWLMEVYLPNKMYNDTYDEKVIKLFNPIERARQILKKEKLSKAFKGEKISLFTKILSENGELKKEIENIFKQESNKKIKTLDDNSKKIIILLNEKQKKLIEIQKIEKNIYEDILNYSTQNYRSNKHILKRCNEELEELNKKINESLSSWINDNFSILRKSYPKVFIFLEFYDFSKPILERAELFGEKFPQLNDLLLSKDNSEWEQLLLERKMELCGVSSKADLDKFIKDLEADKNYSKAKDTIEQCLEIINSPKTNYEPSIINKEPFAKLPQKYKDILQANQTNYYHGLKIIQEFEEIKKYDDIGAIREQNLEKVGATLEDYLISTIAHSTREAEVMDVEFRKINGISKSIEFKDSHIADEIAIIHDDKANNSADNAINTLREFIKLRENNKNLNRLIVVSELPYLLRQLYTTIHLAETYPEFKGKLDGIEIIGYPPDLENFSLNLIWSEFCKMVKYPEDVGYIDKEGMINFNSQNTTPDVTIPEKIFDSLSGTIQLSDGTKSTLADITKNLNKKKPQSKLTDSHDERII